MQSLFTLAYYAWRPFVPFGLSPLYDYLLPFIPFSWPMIASAVLVISVALGLFAFRKRFTFLFICGVVYLFLMMPFLSFTEMMKSPADRHSFVASFISSVIVAFLIALSGKKWRGWIMGICLATCVWLAILTVQQIPIWDDTGKLMRNIIVSLKDRPNEPYLGIVHNRLGSYLWGKGDFPDALDEYALSIAITPNYKLESVIISVCKSDQPQPPRVQEVCSRIMQRQHLTAS